MKLLSLSTLLTASLLTFNACSGVKPNVDEKTAVDDTLPVITLTQNGIMSDMTSIAFEWNSIKDPRVKEIYVYRTSPKSENNKEMQYYESVNSRFKTHYVDDDVSPDTIYSYSFRVLAEDTQGRLSQVYKVNTKPVLQSVAWIHSITGLPRSAKIIWRPHSNQRVQKYIVERKTLEETEWETIETINDRLNAEFLDTELKDNYVYMYRLRAKTYDGIISTPSQIVKVITKPLPKTVTNIRVSTNLPKQIKIDWEATTQKDFSRYYVYRSTSIDGNYELIAKLHNNTFIDKIDEDGARYFYRVSVVDKDGLESENEKNSIMGMTLAKPAAPAIFKAELVGSYIELNWSKVDPRSKSYIIVKETQKGWLDTKRDEFRDIAATHYRDNVVDADTTYTYRIYSLDENKILSESSEPVVVVTPESTEFIEAPKASAVEEQTVKKPVEVKTQEKVIAPAEDLDINEL
ncbi:fibronectin type III domain-containing protein [Sulfurimonas marina]|uniref:Fibronectin type III domain-containing protein n=1 Tax=Sulfurimonas marina TaxID=2590551 RepID=A0A7M1AUD0_9BACT|nr:fibronectin type III domain-containing protein [Sulfurimonas marina]QOP41033.1 fibronectin type III domain-containing protein [Sulfurimonas marina]